MLNIRFKKSYRDLKCKLKFLIIFEELEDDDELLLSSLNLEFETHISYC